jgi:hypothetical protein
MQSKTPTVRCLMDLAKDALKSLYPVGEINSIISILFDHYLGFSKADLIIRADTEMDENISRKVRFSILSALLLFMVWIFLLTRMC